MNESTIHQQASKQLVLSSNIGVRTPDANPPSLSHCPSSLSPLSPSLALSLSLPLPLLVSPSPSPPLHQEIGRKGLGMYAKDPSAGSPTETVLRLILPLSDEVN